MTVAPDLPSLFALPPRFAQPRRFVRPPGPGSARRPAAPSTNPVVIPFRRPARRGQRTQRVQPTRRVQSVLGTESALGVPVLDPPAPGSSAPDAPALGAPAPDAPAPDAPAPGVRSVPGAQAAQRVRAAHAGGSVLPVEVPAVLRLPVVFRPVHVVQALFPAPAPCSSPASVRSSRAIPGLPRAWRATLARPVPVTAPGRLRLTRRGRIVVALLIVLLAAAVSVVIADGVGRPHRRSPVPSSAPAVVVVHPGDTLWGIAERVAPGRDTRAVVAELQQLNLLPTAEVRAGQRLRLRAP